MSETRALLGPTPPPPVDFIRVIAEVDDERAMEAVELLAGYRDLSALEFPAAPDAKPGGGVALNWVGVGVEEE